MPYMCQTIISVGDGRKPPHDPSPPQDNTGNNLQPPQRRVRMSADPRPAAGRELQGGTREVEEDDSERDYGVKVQRNQEYDSNKTILEENYKK